MHPAPNKGVNKQSSLTLKTSYKNPMNLSELVKNENQRSNPLLRTLSTCRRPVGKALLWTEAHRTFSTRRHFSLVIGVGLWREGAHPSSPTSLFCCVCCHLQRLFSASFSTPFSISAYNAFLSTRSLSWKPHIPVEKARHRTLCLDSLSLTNPAFVLWH